jgi:hypothetical protein
VLSFRTTIGMADAVEKAAAAARRSVSEEIKDRVGRTLWEDQNKDAAEIRLEILTRQIMDLVRAIWAAAPVVATNYDDEHLRSALDQGEQPPRGMYSEYGDHGEVARLLPVELALKGADDGGVVIMYRQGDEVIREIPLDAGAARELAEGLLAATSGQKEEPTLAEPNRKSRRRQ